jgi:hypothetical protein
VRRYLYAIAARPRALPLSYVPRMRGTAGVEPATSGLTVLFH